MNRQSHIVSFDEARAVTREGHGASYARSGSLRQTRAGSGTGAGSRSGSGDRFGSRASLGARTSSHGQARSHADSHVTFDSTSHAGKRSARMMQPNAASSRGARPAPSWYAASDQGFSSPSRHESARRSGRDASRSAARRIDYGVVGESSRNTGRGLGRYGESERTTDDRRAASEGKEEPARASAASRLADKWGKFKRSAAKDKADRKFAKQYGGADAAAGSAGAAGAGDAAAGPRAAVYKTEMGSQHRRAARMQGAPSERGVGSSSGRTSSKRRRFSTGAIASLAVTACLVFSCAFLYAPAQQYYQELRERDRLQAEYDAVQQRNDVIQDEVDYLSTAAGVEDRARSEYGWVKKDESAGAVSGLEVEDESTFRANIVPGSIEAPDTWYSFLDPIFGVE